MSKGTACQKVTDVKNNPKGVLFIVPSKHVICIGHVLNEQGTGYEYLISIELKKGASHLKEHPNISKFTKFESYWLKGKGMAHFPKSLK